MHKTVLSQFVSKLYWFVETQMASTSSSALKRSDSIADSMPDALKQSRFHMKKCFARYSFCFILSVCLRLATCRDGSRNFYKWGQGRLWKMFTKNI